MLENYPKPRNFDPKIQQTCVWIFATFIQEFTDTIDASLVAIHLPVSTNKELSVTHFEDVLLLSEWENSQKFHFPKWTSTC